MLKLHNDLQNEMDEGNMTALVMLDHSSAFDTIDHSILFHRLENYFGIRGQALELLKSYLRNRFQKVSIDDTTYICYPSAMEYLRALH